MQQRRTFSEEFKRDAVKLVRQPGTSRAGIARDLGVGANLLGRWCREQEGRFVATRSGSIEAVSTQEFNSMRRELAKVKTERDILKKALVNSTGYCNNELNILAGVSNSNVSRGR